LNHSAGTWVYEFHQKGMGSVLLGSDQYCACHKDMDTEEAALGTMSAGQEQRHFSKKFRVAAHAADPSWSLRAVPA